MSPMPYVGRPYRPSLFMTSPFLSSGGMMWVGESVTVLSENHWWFETKLEALVCPQCGAPLPAPAYNQETMECAYCHSRIVKVKVSI